VPLEGDLAHFRLADILQVIASQRKTGILTVQGKSDILAVSFLEGGIVAADALNQSLDELVGEVLIRRELIEPAQFARLVDEQRGSGERLVDYLVSRQAVSRDQLLQSIEDLTYRLIVDVLRWKEGQFKFYGGEEVAHEEGVHPLRVDDLLMRSMAELPAEEGRAPALVSGMSTYVRTADGRPVRRIPVGFDEHTPLDPGIAWVTTDEELVLERLDGRTNADTLARTSGLGEQRIYYALSRLLGAGLVRELAVGEEIPALAVTASSASTPRPMAAPEALRMDRRFETPEEVRAVPHALGRHLAAAVRIVPLAVAAFVLVVAFTLPGHLLFPAPGQDESRDFFYRARRLARFATIDRAARTYHLLEARYPSSLEELGKRGLLPVRAQDDLEGQPLDYRPKGEEYEIVVSSRDATPMGLREGVFGDFLLDRTLFAELEKSAGVPIVLAD
jgi:hypothetical protein